MSESSMTENSPNDYHNDLQLTAVMTDGTDTAGAHFLMNKSQDHYHSNYHNDLQLTAVMTGDKDTGVHFLMDKPQENCHNYPNDLQLTAVMTGDKDTTGVHFLMDKSQEECGPTLENMENEELKNDSKARTDQLEYMMQDDGSVICKLCGEVLHSRTHWYRHKYKLHVIHPLNPTPLFQCEQCRVYFKSRKGYIGHLASRHSDLLADSSPVLCNSQIEATKEVQSGIQIPRPVIKVETDPELSIPKTSVPNYQTTVPKQTATKSTETKKPCRSRVPEQPNGKDWEEKRSREEKLVADIIDRVRRECEAQGPGPARRGYSRRTTVMNS